MPRSYPLIWTACGGFTMTILISTMPQYGIIMWMLAVPVAKFNFGVDLVSYVPGESRAANVSVV